MWDSPSFMVEDCSTSCFSVWDLTVLSRGGAGPETFSRKPDMEVGESPRNTLYMKQEHLNDYLNCQSSTSRTF